MKFTKYHALGNDYLIYTGVEDFSLSKEEIARICDRRFGVGSDGLLLLGDSTNEKFELRIINPDGSEAEKSGNGLRIFSRYLWDLGLVGDDSFYICTKGGFVLSQVLAKGRCVEISMGKADFSSAAVGFSTNCEQVINYPVEVLGQRLSINAVSMGNPHCVVFLDEITEKVAKQIGPELERHPLFLHRTNVQFVKIINRNNIEVEIWERGAGYTLSSGTSSCAAVAASFLHRYCDQDVCVHMPGGNLEIHIDDDFNVVMRGAVTRIGSIEVDSECLEVQSTYSHK